MAAKSANPRADWAKVLLCSLVVGVASFLTAEGLTPKNVATPGDHDVLLAARLGLIYTPLVGLWLGWIQRSWWRALWGIVAGLGIGFVYGVLSTTREFLAIMVGFPCLLGGVLAGLVGSTRSGRLMEIGLRLAKGMLAGFVLGSVYMVVINVMMLAFWGPVSFEDSTAHRIAVMWRAGPYALGGASPLFFFLMRWAVGLREPCLVDEDGVWVPCRRCGHMNQPNWNFCSDCGATREP